MEEKENAYIDLLLDRCLNFSDSKSLFIDYDKMNKPFILKIVDKAKKMGITDIYLHETDIYKTKEILGKDEEEIKESKYFDSAIWDEYAKKNARFLMIASEFPGILDDADNEKITLMSKIKMETKPVYKKMQKNDELIWLIAVYPNEVWAKYKFPDLDKIDAYQKLFDLMMDVVMCNTKDPISAWNKFLETQDEHIKIINDLKIKELHYKNSKGTDLTIGYSESCIWTGAENKEHNYIANMPSYEIFTSPDYHKTEGIVYATKPLYYANCEINDFWVKFKDGRVVDYDARKGKDILKEIIETDLGTHFLGESALVDKNSPIARKNFIFGETCLDENASCHIALGTGFSECVKNAKNLSEEELEEIGLNDSKNHVDFMIGSDDLEITAKTFDGKTVEIFKNGEFSI